MNRKLHPWITVAILALLMIGAGLIRAHLLESRPLWDDELWHRAIVRESTYRQLFLWSYNEFHPPISFVINRLCYDLLGSDTAWTWRLPTFVCGLLCIPAAFRLGRRIASDLLGLGVATLVAVDLNLTWESQNARMYTMFALLMLVFLAEAIPLLRQPQASLLRWSLSGALLAGLLWIQVLALTVWGAFGCTVVGLLVVQRIWPKSGDDPRRLLIGTCVTFAVATVLGAPGLYRFLTYQGEAGVTIPQHSLTELTHMIYWVTGLLVWIDLRFITPLVLVCSLVGILILSARHREAALLFLALAGFTILSQFQIVKAHAFTDCRYLIPLEPVIWVGLPYLCLCASPPRLRVVAIAFLSAFASFQVWNCTRLLTTYGSIAVDVPESRTFVQATSFVHSNQLPEAAVSYIPFDRFAYRGEYFGLPASPALGPGPVHPPSIFPPRAPESANLPFVHDGFQAPEAWVIARVGRQRPLPSRGPSLPTALAALARQFDAPFDAGTLDQFATFDGWLVTRVDRSGLRFTTFP